MCESACVEVLDVARNVVEQFIVADSCQGCGYGGLDFTLASLAVLGRSAEDGKFAIQWRFC